MCRCHRRHFNVLSLELFVDIMINGVTICIFSSCWRIKRPVAFIFRTLINPLLDQLNLIFSEFLACFWRWHNFVIILGNHSSYHFTIGSVSRYDSLQSVFIFKASSIFDVETEFCFSFMFVRPVAGKTIVRKQRSNVSVEFNFFFTLR